MVFLVVRVEIAVLFSYSPNKYVFEMMFMDRIGVVQDESDDNLFPSYEGTSANFPDNVVDYEADFLQNQDVVVEYDQVSEKREAYFSIPEGLREKPKLFDKYRDALYSLSGAVDLKGLSDEFSIHQSHEIHLYRGNKLLKSPFKPTPCIHFPPTTSCNV